MTEIQEGHQSLVIYSWILKIKYYTNGPFDKFSNDSVHPREVFEQINNVDLEYILNDSKGYLKLMPVSGRYAGQDANGVISFDVAPYHRNSRLPGPRGVVINPGTSVINFIDPKKSFHALTIIFNVLIPT